MYEHNVTLNAAQSCVKVSALNETTQKLDENSLEHFVCKNDAKDFDTAETTCENSMKIPEPFKENWQFFEVFNRNYLYMDGSHIYTDGS